MLVFLTLSLSDGANIGLVALEEGLEAAASSLEVPASSSRPPPDLFSFESADSSSELLLEEESSDLYVPSLLPSFSASTSPVVLEDSKFVVVDGTGTYSTVGFAVVSFEF